MAAMAAAFYIRFVLFRGENPVGGFGYHMLWAGLFSPVYAVLFGLLGVYEPQPESKKAKAPKPGKADPWASIRKAVKGK